MNEEVDAFAEVRRQFREMIETGIKLLVRRAILGGLRHCVIHRCKRKYLMRFAGDRKQTRKDLRIDRHGKR